MERGINWRRSGWRALLFGFGLVIAGCKGETPPTGSKEVEVAPGPPPAVQADHSDGSAKAFIGQFLENLSGDEPNPELFSVAFKKRIARPLTPSPDEAEMGYSAKDFASYLGRIAGAPYETKFVFVEAAEGPYALGEVKTQGQMEGYLIHLAPVDAPANWQVDWFQRTKVFIPCIIGSPNPGMVGAELAVHRFMDNLLGGDLTLAEATLSPAWKKANCWSGTPSDAELGYSRALVKQRLQQWKGDYPAYVIERKGDSDVPAVFDVTALDAQKNPQKIFTLTIKKEPGGDWVVDNIDVK